MDLKETKVRLTAGAKERIVALVGNYGMAKFIRQAVDDAIKEAEAAAKRKPSKEAAEDGE